MGLGSSKPIRHESKDQAESPRSDPSPQRADLSESDPIRERSQSNQNDDVLDLATAQIDEQAVQEVGTSIAIAEVSKQTVTATPQNRLAVLRQAALRSALEKRRREAGNAKQKAVVESQLDNDQSSSSASPVKSAFGADQTSHPLAIPGYSITRSSASILEAPHIHGSPILTHMPIASQEEDVDMDRASTKSASSAPSIPSQSRRLSQVSNGDSEDEHELGTILHYGEDGSAPAQYQHLPPQLTSPRNTDDTGQCDDMDMDHDSSDEDWSQLSEVHEDYYYEVQRLLAWGMPPSVLISHGVNVYDIRRVLLPYYRPSPPPPPITTPPALPLPPGEVNSHPTRLTIHSQYKPLSPETDAKGSLPTSISPSPPPVRRPPAAVQGRFFFDGPPPRATVLAKSHHGKQKNWDRPTDQAPVVLRYESRSPSPSPAIPIPPVAPEDNVITDIEELEEIKQNSPKSTAAQQAASFFPDMLRKGNSTVVPPADAVVANHDDTAPALARASRLAALASLRARKATPGLRQAFPSVSIDNTITPIDRDLPPTTVALPSHLESGLSSSTTRLNGVGDATDPEDGEISDSPSHASDPDAVASGSLTPLPLVVPSVSLPRGVKRPAASDFEGQPISSSVNDASQRLRKRALFGGSARRAAQLLVELSDSSDEEESSGQDDLDRSRLGSEIEASRRMLADKEEEIRQAKERLLAAIQKKKSLKLANVASAGTATPGLAGYTTSEGIPDLDSSVLAVVTEADHHRQHRKQDFRGNAASKTISDTAAASTSTSPVLQSDDPLTTNVVHGSSNDQPTHEKLLADDNSSSSFTPYHSRLASVPQIGIRSHSSVLTPTLDEHLLSSVVLTRIINAGNSVRLCAFELNGGVCSDASCQELHLGRDVHITDSDLAAYLSRSTTSHLSPAQISFAIDEARRNQPAMQMPTLFSATSAINSLLADVVTILGLV